MSAVVFVLARGQNLFFTELVAAIRDELDLLGVPSRVALGPFPEPEADTAYVLVPPHEWYWLEHRFGDPDTTLFPRTIFLTAEQPGTTHFDDNVNLAERAAAVFDISRRGVRELKHRGRDAEHFQLGWTQRWDAREGAGERDLELLFMGCATERRLKHLASYASLAWGWRSRIVLSDNSRPNASGHASFVEGREKLELLARTKVLLNLHQSDTKYFEWLRAVEAISNGAAIVSESSSDYAPLVPGEHMLIGRPETLGMLTHRLLEDEDERRRIAEGAYRLLRDELPLRSAVERLAEAAGRAARAPLSAARARQARRRRALSDEAPVLLDGPGDTTHDPSMSALKAGVRDLRLDVLDLRRELDHDRIVAVRGGEPPVLVPDSWSPAWSGARAKVSVLTTLYNYGHHIEAALDSVANSGYDDLELIVLDDASTDDSVERVRDWIGRHPSVPTLLVRRSINGGLPRARNAALGFARAPYSFILDADNEVYPNSLARLVAALDFHSRAVFSYGMLERFDQDGALDLVSWYPWEPSRLRVGNYIDAMALLRTSALRELGGYTTDRRLYGWEDYDLWCRVAESGGFGMLVPEIVARYRVSRTSMLSFTNLSATVAYSVLIERYPRLMAGVRPPL